MRYTTLGRSGLKVSRLILGTMNFGDYTSQEESFRIMDRAIDAGINCFDTADFYGRPLGIGGTETVVGNWIAQGDKREKIVLATKIYATMGPGVNDRGLSAYHVRRATQDCLKRLHTDHIDLLQMHHIDRGVRSIPELGNIGLTKEWELDGSRFDTPWEEIAESFGLLKQAGDISYVGTCNMPAWQLTRGNMTMQKLGQLGIVSEQSIYNLVNRNIELEVLPAAKAQGIGMIIWSPLGSGVLAGKPTSSGGRRTVTSVSPQQQAYEKLCAEYNMKPAEVALAWLLTRDGVTAPIIGPRTIEQLESALNAIELQLPNEMLLKLDGIFAPVGEAPEAYAW